MRVPGSPSFKVSINYASEKSRENVHFQISSLMSYVFLCWFVWMWVKICVLFICIYPSVSSAMLVSGWSLRLEFRWGKMNCIALNWKLHSSTAYPHRLQEVPGAEILSYCSFLYTKSLLGWHEAMKMS